MRTNEREGSHRPARLRPCGSGCFLLRRERRVSRVRSLRRENSGWARLGFGSGSAGVRSVPAGPFLKAQRPRSLPIYGSNVSEPRGKVKGKAWSSGAVAKRIRGQKPLRHKATKFRRVPASEANRSIPDPAMRLRCGALRLPAPRISRGCRITYADGRMNVPPKDQGNAG